MHFETIAAISRARIERVIEEITSQADLATPAAAGLGLRSFTLAPSNFKQWRGDGIDTAEQLAEQMALFTQTEKPGAQVEDMLYELLLKFGQELTTPVQALEVAGGRVFAVNGGAMLFVLEPLNAEMVMSLVALAPRELIAIEGAFQDSDTLKTNLDLQCRDAGIRFTCV
jgi:adenine-specific DNA-methyltransferase